MYIDDAWTGWLKQNYERGCEPESMIEAMVRAGFDDSAATTAVYQTAAGGVVRGEALASAEKANGYCYDRPQIPPGNVIRAEDRDVHVAMRMAQPEVVVFDDVLTQDECERMIERARSRVRPSTTVDPDSGREEVIADRTSKGIWFANGEDDFIARLERRIASLVNWPLENGEGLQVLHYPVGAEYRPHFDYFPPGRSGSNVHLRRGGQRVATLIVYLNDVESGGDTIFPEVGLSVVARRGAAVYFRYMNSTRQLDALTLHGGAPVTGGEKWIMTRWLRERAYC